MNTEHKIDEKFFKANKASPQKKAEVWNKRFQMGWSVIEVDGKEIWKMPNTEWPNITLQISSDN